MNKSKFLKKSLAMLLALMLVLAMIPLSASAAEGESVYFKDLYVDGQRAAVNGDQLSSDVVETTEVDLTVGTLNGAELYVDVKDTDNDKILPVADLDLTDETMATKTDDNKYQVGILVKVKDNPESDDAKIVETYTLTITVKETQPGDDVLLRGLQAGKETWANLVSYEVIHPEDTDNNEGLVNITLKFGYNAPKADELEGGVAPDSDFEAIDPTSKIDIVDDKTIVVQSSLGSRSTYKLAYTWQAAFESFEIPGQDGETEFVWNGQDGNKININVPYAYSFDDVIPTFEFANGVDNVWVKGSSPKIESDYTVLDDKLDPSKNPIDAKWNNVRTITLCVDNGDIWPEITLTITGVAKNPEGDLKTIQITDKNVPANASNTTEAELGSTFEVEMPKGTPISDNTFTVTMVASKDAKVVYIDGDTTDEVFPVGEDPSPTTSQYKFDITTGEDEDAVSFTIQVTPEAGGTTKNYNVNMTIPKVPKARLMNVVATNGTESYTAEINHTKNEVRLKVPYSWLDDNNTAGAQLFMKASTGATITHSNGKSTWDRNESKAFNLQVSKKGGSTDNWLPYFNENTYTTVTVTDNDSTPQDANTYKIYLETLPAKTERKISDITFVGTDKPYEITPSNTYETTLGTAKLDGTEVRTIEVTVPYSFDDLTNKKGYISDWTISKGAVAYGGWDDVKAFSPLGDNSETNKYPWAFELDKYMDGKDADGNLVKGSYLPIYVLSEEYAVPEGNVIEDTSKYIDKSNASIYYLVVKKAAPETGHEMLSIESADPNVTATLKDKTITITVPYSYEEDKTPFALNFELSKLAKLSGKNNTDTANLITSGVTQFCIGGDDYFKFKSGTDWFSCGEKPEDMQALYVFSETGAQSQAYQLKIVVDKEQTGAEITSLSVNGVAGTITQDKINVRLPLGSKLYPVTLDLTASKMASVYVDHTVDPNTPYDADAQYDVNDDVTIKVVSEDEETTNYYTLTVTVSDSFNDVSSSEWYYDEVMTAANAGWINGTKPGYFEPNGTMTRADFMVIIARILDCDTEATVESLFPDCNETDYFNAAVTFCKLRGIIDGDDKGYFNPYDAITREEMAKILCNALELDELETSADPFDDDAEIAQWAKGYVNAVQAEGIMEGSNGSFNPRDNATRAEGAAVLVRAFA